MSELVLALMYEILLLKLKVIKMYSLLIRIYLIEIEKLGLYLLEIKLII